jgi:hypothetical protein
MINNSNRYAIISYGRMNPPHNGHSLIFETINALQHQYPNSYGAVFLSAKSGDRKNPLTPETKLEFVRKSFPNQNIFLENSNQGILGIVKDISEQGYKHLIFVCGEDRLNEYVSLLNKYNGKEFNFEEIIVYSAGNRNEKSNSIKGYSGTKMRQLVSNGDYDTFETMTSEHLNGDDKLSLFTELRKQLDEDMNKDFNKAMLNRLYEGGLDKGFPVVPDDEEPRDNPDPVKDKDVDWSKVKKITPAKGKKFSQFRAPIVGSQIGIKTGSGVGPTYDTRYGGGAGSASGGIGDPSFTEGTTDWAPLMPAYGFHGSSNKEPFSSMNDKVLSNVTLFSKKDKNTKNFKQLRKSLPYG